MRRERRARVSIVRTLRRAGPTGASLEPCMTNRPDNHVRHDLEGGPLGVVVVGAGDLGSRHAQHWCEAGAKVIAVCDPWPERAALVAAAVGAEAATHPYDYLKRDDVHVVSVCTPTFLHESYS